MATAWVWSNPSNHAQIRTNAQTTATLPTEPEKRSGRTLPAHLQKPSIRIRKSTRALELYEGASLVRSYRVGLGFAPSGDKRAEGDGRTPEGVFYVCTRKDQSKYTRSLGLSYPNMEDAERGMHEGRITRAEYEAIAIAICQKRCPPWNTPLGGAICIHGSGALRDWTLGCIALDDADMLELFEVIPMGTEVIVEP